MKVLLYSEGLKYIAQSGVGRAIKHQMKALELNNIEYTTNPKDNYDIIHINTTGPRSCYLAYKSKKQGKKVIMHAHSTEEDFKDSFFFANLVAPLFKKEIVFAYGLASEIITPTPYSKKIIDSYNIGLKCTPVSNGIDLTRFTYNEKAANDFLKQYHFSPTDTIILSVGLQIKRKGILDFIKLAKKMPKHQFVWCGYTSKWLMTRDVKRAMNNLPANVHMLGYVTNMIGAYSACNIFFMPTHEETEGIVVLEALAMKKPVLIRNIPVYDDWLNDNIDCHKGSNNTEFVSKIQGILNKHLPDTTFEGYEIAKNRTLEKIGKQLINIYTA